jgi:hypothetical protein
MLKILLVNHGRFQPFYTLLTNFSDNIQLFQSDIPSLNQNFIRKINDLREDGNNSAHVLELDT